MRRSIAVLALSLSSSSCLVRTAPLSSETPAPEQEESLPRWEAEPPATPRRARVRTPSAGDPIFGPTRFQVVASARHDLGSIPLARRSERIPSSGAVLNLDGSRAWSDEGPTAIVGSLPSQQRPLCFSEDDGSLVSFETFKLASSSANELDYGRHVGLAERCQVRAMRSSKMKVPALVRGLLYAYQLCVDDADCDARSLVLVAPKPDFAASEGRYSPAESRISNGSFALLELPIRRGEATSATINLNGQALAAWRVVWGQPVPSDAEMPMIASRTLSIRVESVWPAADGAPALSTLVSVDGAPSRTLAAFLGLTSKD